MVDCQSETKRITLKRTRPNPLFQEWLETLLEEAKAKQSKLEPMLYEAITSLSKYPLPLESGAECAILKGFNKRLCKFLDHRLRVYNNWLQENQVNHNNSQSPANTDSASPDLSTIPKKRVKKTIGSENCSNNVDPQNDHVDSNDVIVLCDPTPEPSTSNREAEKGSPCDSGNTLEPPSIVSSKDVNIPTFQDSSGSSSQNACASSMDQNSSQSSAQNSKRPCKGKKEYKPSFRSGSYAILMALFEHQKENHNDSALSKEKLIDIAQKYSEESFVRPKPDSFYTAWSNMSTLVKKGLVDHVKKKKSVYSLTDQGISLAAKLWEDTKNIPTVNDIIFNNASTSKSVGAVNNDLETVNGTGCSKASTSKEKQSQATILDEITTFQFIKGSFDVILLIDKNETGGVSNKNDPTVAQFNKYPNLKHEYRSLKVGDFTWVARHKVNKDQELVLPYIVERKRMDDLGASIKDGRFHEQKFRLRKCGLKNVIYLVESYGSNKHVGLPLQSLMQALANTRIQDGFKVQCTDSLTHTARFLAMMTKRLTIEYEAKPIIAGIDSSPPSSDVLMTFNFFNKSSVKNKPLTVKEAFIKLLLQLKGVSVEKALAITNVYSTPKLLIKEYEKHNQKDGEKLLANLKYGDLNRNVGPSVSKAIHSFLTWNE